jgi:hypothetical protein
MFKNIFLAISTTITTYSTHNIVLWSNKWCPVVLGYDPWCPLNSWTHISTLWAMTATHRWPKMAKKGWKHFFFNFTSKSSNSTPNRVAIMVYRVTIWGHECKEYHGWYHRCRHSVMNIITVALRTCTTDSAPTFRALVVMEMAICFFRKFKPFAIVSKNYILFNMFERERERFWFLIFQHDFILKIYYR